MPNRYEDELKLDFPIFSNDNRLTDKHPVKTGKVEFTEPFLRQMFEYAKTTSTMPTLRVAVWDRLSKDGKISYENIRLTMEQAKQEEKKSDFPFDL